MDDHELVLRSAEERVPPFPVEEELDILPCLRSEQIVGDDDAVTERVIQVPDDVGEQVQEHFGFDMHDLVFQAPVFGHQASVHQFIRQASSKSDRVGFGLHAQVGQYGDDGTGVESTGEKGADRAVDNQAFANCVVGQLTHPFDIVLFIMVGNVLLQVPVLLLGFQAARSPFYVVAREQFPNSAEHGLFAGQEGEDQQSVQGFRVGIALEVVIGQEGLDLGGK